MARAVRCHARGFTLIELLVAVGVLALMAVLSWRGLDGMARTQSRLQERADAVLALQAGLAQWGADLDALLMLPALPALDWDGRALRLTRRATTTVASTGSGLSEEDLLVVAWSRRDVDGVGQWLRWQSPALRTRGDVQAAWAQAAQWAQNPGDDLKAREVRVLPMAQWQIFYFRGDAWTNPLSAVGNTAGVAAAGIPAGAEGSAAAGVAGAGAGANALTGGLSGVASAALARGVAALAAGLPGTTNLVDASIPQGVRLVLTLPPGQAITGTLTRDWVLPTMGGGKI